MKGAGGAVSEQIRLQTIPALKLDRVYIFGGKSLTEDEWRTNFEEFGEIRKITVVTDKASNENRGMCYIHFSKTSEAAAAVEAMNGRTIGDMSQPLKVKFAQGKSKPLQIDTDEDQMLLRLFIKAPKTMTHDDIKEYFEKFGDIEWVRILKDKGTKDSRGYAFVKFQTMAAAARALEEAESMYKPRYADVRLKMEEEQSQDRLYKPAESMGSSASQIGGAMGGGAMKGGAMGGGAMGGGAKGRRSMGGRTMGGGAMGGGAMGGGNMRSYGFNMNSGMGMDNMCNVQSLGGSSYSMMGGGGMRSSMGAGIGSGFGQMSGRFGQGGMSGDVGYNESCDMGFNGSRDMGYNGSRDMGYNGSRGMGYTGSRDMSMANKRVKDAKDPMGIVEQDQDDDDIGPDSVEATMPIANMTQEQVFHLFDIAPGLESCTYDASTGVAKIQYKSAKCAAYAKQKIDGLDYAGNKITVKFGKQLGPHALKKTAEELQLTLKQFKSQGSADPDQLSKIMSSLERVTEAIQNQKTEDSYDENTGQEMVPWCSVPLPPRKPKAPYSAPIQCRLFVVAVPDSFGDDVLENAFCRFGDLIQVKFQADKRFGFAKFARQESGDACKEALHGAYVLNNRLKIEYANNPDMSKRDRSENEEESDTKRLRQW